MNPQRLIFLGSSAFAVPALEALTSSLRFKPAAVFTQPDRQAGRHLRPTPTPVKQAALRLGLTVLQPEDVNSEASLQLLGKLQPDLLITAAYGQKLKRAVRESATRGAINLHPSLLPQLRGAAPIPFALWEGRTETGLTIFKLTARMDAGPFFLQKKLPIQPGENAAELASRLALEAAGCLLEFLERWTVQPWEPIPQDEAKATYCRKLDKSDLVLDWSLPASEIYNHIRALAPEPGAVTFFRARQLKVLAADLTESAGLALPGAVTAVLKNAGFAVQTGKGQLLLRTIQPAGKPVMSAWAFQLGARIEPGERLENHA